MNEPTFLYHYTSVGALALILKNRTLRFSSLAKLDDPTESRARDLSPAAKLCYISSWTATSEENIPLWREYASVDSGVRIGLPVEPFKWTIDTGEAVARDPSIPTIDHVNGRLKTRLCLADQIKQGVSCFTAPAEKCLYKVEYTNDKERLYPSVERSENEYALGLLGMHKPKVWEYQDEWRYIHLAVPADTILFGDNPYPSISRLIYKLHGTIPMDMPDYLEFPLDGSALSNMEITLAHLIHPGYELLVHDLVEKYCCGAKLLKSAVELV